MTQARRRGRTWVASSRRARKKPRPRPRWSCPRSESAGALAAIVACPLGLYRLALDRFAARRTKAGARCTQRFAAYATRGSVRGHTMVHDGVRVAVGQTGHTFIGLTNRLESLVNRQLLTRRKVSSVKGSSIQLGNDSIFLFIEHGHVLPTPPTPHHFHGLCHPRRCADFLYRFRTSVFWRHLQLACITRLRMGTASPMLSLTSGVPTPPEPGTSASASCTVM